MAGYIPKEQLQAFTRWQANDFSSPAPKQPENPPAAAPVPPSDNTPPEASSAPPVPSSQSAAPPRPETPLPTVEELERIHEEAHVSGYQDGFEEGRKAGYDAGHSEGLEAGNSAAQAHIEQCQAFVQSLQEAFARFDQEMAESVLNCALEVAQQVVRSVVHVKPETLLPIIREALAALPLQHSSVTLLVAPETAQFVQEQLGNSFSAAGWRIHGDPEIAPGGCRLKAGGSEVDATLATRWRRTLEAIGIANADAFLVEDTLVSAHTEVEPNSP